jgi:hypothetical protein
MSFGALSPNAVRALNTGAKKGRFAHDTGEGGVSPYHRENGGDIIWEIGSGYFGCRNRDGSFNPDEFARVGSFEPTPEGVVTLQVRVDCVVHGRDVALAGHLAAGDDLTREVQSRIRAVMVVAEVLTLHVADRHGADGRLASLLLRCRGGVPRRHGSRTHRPLVKSADGYIADAQELRPPSLPGCRSRHLTSRRPTYPR